MSRESIVQRARIIAEDVEFSEARAWMKEHGLQACGTLPVYAPREVVHAAGMVPIGLSGLGERMEIIRGDALYQSYICHLPRSVVELALAGRFDFLSAALFPSTCDVIRNLSGVWKVIAPEVVVRYLDLPQVEDTGLATEFWKGELGELYETLCACTGMSPDPDRLRDSIALYDGLRRRIAALYEGRRVSPWLLPSEELHILLRAAEVMAPEAWCEMADAYLEAPREGSPKRRDTARVIVLGGFCEQPPLGLIRTIERAGCTIVDDDFLVGNRLVEEVGEPGDDPLLAMATALVERAQPTSILYERDPDAKRALVRRRVEAAGADGVIFAAPSFCDPALLDRPMLRAGAEDAEIPCIAFKYAENSGQFQPFREQAGAFADSIKLWGGR